MRKLLFIVFALLVLCGCEKVAYLPKVTSEATVSGNSVTILFEVDRGDEGYNPRLEFDTDVRFKAPYMVFAEVDTVDGRYKVVLEGLQPNTTYYYRFIVSNSAEGSIIVNNKDSFATLSASSMEYGELLGLFSVSEHQRVCFSKGNLQYKASINTWRFANNQFDCIGEDNQNISQYYDGWIDFFGWGTSGYDHGASSYQPWSTNTYTFEYYAYGEPNLNLYDENSQADWGYNAISNGGNMTNTWRTLTRDEWVYVFNTRETSSGIRFVKANVSYVNGIILLPDEWNSSIYDLNDPNNNASSYNSNVIGLNEWLDLQSSGAVFLPAAGGRDERAVVDVGDCGYYWSSSSYNVEINNNKGAYALGFDNGAIDCQYAALRYVGMSVRLVRNK